MNLGCIGLDTSKAVFTLHGVDQDEKAVLRRNVRRAGMAAFFTKLPPTHVALKACGGSHHWGRRLAAMGHTVQLIPPQYVKPFVRRGKSDRNDAEAISAAAVRPDMPGIAVKSAEQQAGVVVLSAHELLVRQRTQLVNAVRGHVEPRGSPVAAEFGIVAVRGLRAREACRPSRPGARRPRRRVPGQCDAARLRALPVLSVTPFSFLPHRAVFWRPVSPLPSWAEATAPDDYQCPPPAGRLCS